MKITISNKKIEDKPSTDKEKGRFFGKKGSPNRIKFMTKEIELDELEQLIGEGFTLAYQYQNDDAMSRKAGYIGTDYIIIDIDGTDYSIEDVLSMSEHKPTIIHTTFSNMTEKKGYKHCYHLIYCMSSTLYGEDNFTRAFQYFSKEIEGLVDPKAKDCHRVVFTSNCNLPHYEFVNTGIIYDVDLLPCQNLVFDEECPKVEVSPLSIPPATDILVNDKNGQHETRNTKMVTNVFNLDDAFFSDLNTMSRTEFIAKYDSVYPWITSTVVSYNDYGYANLTGINYYEVYSKYKWNPDLGKGQKQKVCIGHRDKQLFVDAINYINVNPDMSREELVLDLIREVHYNYDNSDGEMSNNRIVTKAMSVWQNKTTLTSHPQQRKFKIDKAYWTSTNTSSMKAVGIVRSLIKDEEISEYIDFSLSLEANIRLMHQSGVKITKSRLTEFCKKYDYNLASESDLRAKRVIELYDEDNSRSYRIIAEMCNREGIKVSKTTVNDIIRNHRGHKRRG